VEKLLGSAKTCSRHWIGKGISKSGSPRAQRQDLEKNVLSLKDKGVRGRRLSLMNKEGVSRSPGGSWREVGVSHRYRLSGDGEGRKKLVDKFGRKRGKDGLETGFNSRG